MWQKKKKKPKNIKLQAYVSDYLDVKILLKNAAISNLAIYKKNYIPQPSGVMAGIIT